MRRLRGGEAGKAPGARGVAPFSAGLGPPPEGEAPWLAGLAPSRLEAASWIAATAARARASEDRSKRAAVRRPADEASPAAEWEASAAARAASKECEPTNVMGIRPRELTRAARKILSEQ